MKKKQLEITCGKWLFKPIIILYILSLLHVSLYSSSPKMDLSQWVPRVYSTENGFPQNTVRAIAQTDDGYLWLGAYEGLTRFDGVRFETFNKSNTPEFKHNNVRVLLKDRWNRLWIGSARGLLQYYDGKFKHFSTKDGLTSSNINSLYEDTSGTLWIGTTHGLNCRKNDTFISYYLDTGGTHYPITAICEADDGYLWVGTEGRGLYRFKQGIFKAYSGSRGLPGKQVWALSKDKNGDMWIGTTDGLVLHRQGKFYLYSENHGLRGLTVHCIHQGRDGISWVTTTQGGLNRLKDGTITPLNTVENLGNCGPECVFQDKEGSLWLGTYECGMFQLTQPKFFFYGKHTGFPPKPVRPLMGDRKGTMWIGTIGGGLVRIKNGQVKIYRSHPGLENDFITSIALDKDGSPWIGTYYSGLIHLQDNQFITYSTKQGLSGNIIRAITVDRSGKVWVGTNSWGVDVLEDGKVIAHYSTKNGLSDDFIYAIAEDKEGEIWIGTYTGGVNRLKNNTVTIYNSRKTRDFPETFVWAIYPDQEGNIWCGTDGSGLLRFQKKENKWDFFTAAHGLASDKAFVVLEDHLGYLWMNNDNGIFKVKKQELQALSEGKIAKVSCTSYGREQGIFNTGGSGPAQPAGWSSQDGTLWFQNPRGVVVVDPANIPFNSTKPPVIIEKVVINQKDYPRAMDITAPPGEGSMEIRYTATSFRVPGQVLFKYRLEGFEKEWVEAGTRRTAIYTNLPHGDFTFKVIACNNDGVWNDEGASLNIKILPPFWHTSWFRFLALLFFIGLIYLFLKLRTRTIENQKRKLKKEVQLQTRELKEAREKAENAARSKSAFLARMSHEIRTPINAVIGFTEMLLDTDLNEEQRDFTRTINQSGEALRTLINDILDFSKIEAGQLSFESVDFEPGAAAYDVCETILPRLANKPVEVLCRIDDRVPALVKGDPGRFRQVVTNLMSNAAKFTPVGEIELSVFVEREEAHRVLLNIKVRDTGIGIPADKLDSIFGDFQQADISITRKFGGTGLGLAICSQIAHMMGGQIRAESTPGKGSIFTFTAWFKLPTEEPRKPEESFCLTGKRILLVDDNINNLDILSHHLEQVGARTVSLNDPALTIETLQKELVIGDSFDLCIIDANMPGMDGLELARRIRSLDSPVAKIPLLAFSSLISRQTRTFKESGFDDYLSKPVRKIKLLSRVTQLLGEKEQKTDQEEEEKKPVSPVTPDSGKDETARPVSILLAEDDHINRKLADYMLSKAGYTLEMVENGKEAVSVYLADPDKFDLILMDIQMPMMDGKEATRRIRAAGFTNIPIIAMTAESMKGDREKCLEAGMDDYISKPIKRDTVYRMVKKYIQKT
ncbi:MAG: response regulator [Candidatus Aminicenantes bacterium]|nr:MAG: response regulator [Candidatus Aminicenantes bacterium]